MGGNHHNKKHCKKDNCRKDKHCHKKDCKKNHRKKCCKREHCRKNRCNRCQKDRCECDRREDCGCERRCPDYPFDDTPPPGEDALQFASFFQDSMGEAVAPGEAITFNNPGFSHRLVVNNLGNGVFRFPRGGAYQVDVSIPVEAPGGAIVYRVNGTELPYTTVSIADGTIQMGRIVLIPEGGTLSVINPSASTTDLQLAATSIGGVQLKTYISMRLVHPAGGVIAGVPGL